jgi:hypothetical protein
MTKSFEEDKSDTLFIELNGLTEKKIVIKLKQILFMIHLKALDQAHAVAI